jgi:hypothetical protein
MEDRQGAGKQSWDLTKALRNPMSLVGMRSTEAGAAINNEQALGALMTKLYDQCSTLRAGHHAQWQLNLCNLLGYQNVAPAANPLAIRKVEDAPWRVRHVAPMAGMAAQRLIAKVTRLTPRPEVIPSSTDYQHQRSARMAEMYLMAKVEQFGLQKYIQEWVLKALIYSKAYFKVYWDTSSGEYLQDNNGEKFFDGDIGFAIDDPTTLFHEPGVTALDDATWAFSATLKTRGWVADHYPEVDDDISRGSSTAARPGASILDQTYQVVEGSPRVEMDYCLVREFWIRPKEDSDDQWRHDGCWFVMVDEKLASGPEPFPYHNGKLPWVELTDAFMQGLGTFGPTCVAQWLPSNHLYNRLTSMVMEHLNLCGRPKVLMPKGSNVAKSAFTSQPGEIAEYTPLESGHKPEYMRPADMNEGAFLALANRQLADFDNVTGQHEVSRGISPGAASPAAAIEQLIQADDTVLRPIADQLRISYAELFRRLLELERQFGEDRDIVVYGGGKQTPKTMQFSGSSLEYRDVRIEPNSLKPTSPIAQREQIYRLAQVGLLGPFQSPQHEAWAKRVLSVMEWGDAGALFQEASKDKERAQWENDQLDEIRETVKQYDPKIGQYLDQPILGDLVPNPYDNHADHIEEHELRQKDLSFNILPSSAKRAHLMHTELHKNAMVEGVKQPEQIEAGLRKTGILEPTTPEQAAVGNPELNQQMAQAQGDQAQAQLGQTQAQINQAGAGADQARMQALLQAIQAAQPQNPDGSPLPAGATETMGAGAGSPQE